MHSFLNMGSDMTIDHSKVTVTIEECVQIGPDDFRMKRYSRTFSTNRPLKDMISWAENMGIKGATINSLTFHDYTGESI